MSRASPANRLRRPGVPRCLRQVFDLQAVVVVAPFAAGQDGLGDFLDGQVRPAVGLAAEGSHIDQQPPAFAHLVAQLLELLRGSSLCVVT